MPRAIMKAAGQPLLSLTAADLMTTPVTTIPEYTSLREAARLLSRAGISGAPVVDADGRCLGVLSSGDFVVWAGKQGEEVHFIAPWGEVVSVDDAPDNEIRHYMTVQPVAVAPETPIGELAQKMIDAHIHRVLVVEDGRPCGIITGTDILAAVALAARKASLKRKGNA
jgi:CBS domain-containing protein